MPERPAAGARLAEAIEALSEGFAAFDEDGRLETCNRRFHRFNSAIADLLEPGANWDLLLREAELRGTLDQASARSLAALERQLSPDGTPGTMQLELSSGHVLSITLAATRSGGFVMTQKDITARRRLEDESREADQLLRSVLEACPASVLMSRMDDGQVLYRSPAATALLGPVRSESAVFASREQRADFITELLPTGHVEAMAFTGIAANGARFPASISARMIDFRGEDVIVATIADLSAEVAMRTELAAQRETLYQNEKMSALGELLAGVAHELNNPLTVVLGHAQILEEEAADPRTLRRVGNIRLAADRCTRIVRSFLAMARQQPSALAPIDLNATATLALDVLRTGPSGLGAKLEVVLDPGIPRVLADEDQITQVVANLVQNAEQAISGAGCGDLVRVSTAVDAGAGMVELRVEDNGPGIPEAIRGRVFEPFFTTKQAGKGTGLGLALCHRVVTSHHGEIRVAARAGGGTVFTVRLPAAGQGEHRATRLTAAPTVAFDRARVLVVEDEDEVAELMCEVLARQGFQVDRSASAEHALALVAERAYSAVLSDINMSGIGGRGLYEAIRRDHPALLPRLGFVTGDALGPAASTLLAEAQRPCLEKPVVPEELRRFVAQLLS